MWESGPGLGVGAGTSVGVGVGTGVSVGVETGVAVVVASVMTVATPVAVDSAGPGAGSLEQAASNTTSRPNNPQHSANQRIFEGQRVLLEPMCGTMGCWV